VEFLDTPRFLADGYGLVSLGMAALANATRSPTDLQRDAGLVMPSYSELAAEAKAYVHIARLVGDDLIVTGQSDRSALVNACGSVGMIGSSMGGVAGVALMTGILLPALGKARESAKQVKSAAQLRGISMAIMTYAADNADKLPASMDELIQKEFITADLLDSPVGPAADGGDDYWLNLSVKKLADVKNPTDKILGYDRAMYAKGDMVAVVFFDGHVQQVAVWQFQQLIQEEPNAGTDFDLPFADEPE
jgi:hypothetical protein